MTTWTVQAFFDPGYQPMLRFHLESDDGSNVVDTVFDAEAMRTMALHTIRAAAELIAVSDVARHLEAEGVPESILTPLVKRHLDALARYAGVVTDGDDTPQDGIYQGDPGWPTR